MPSPSSRQALSGNVQGIRLRHRPVQMFPDVPEAAHDSCYALIDTALSAQARA
ncbi:hypothetical protein ACF1GW_10240 [Streptomyces achromogenes]|uniref:hypothetical protein n=1 Tax=Streptomyces achromogenes TaxID=67255 RepID=UPI0036FA370B